MSPQHTWTIRTTAVASTILLIGLATFVMTGGARGHDSWINKGGFRDPQTKSHCCGENDCEVIPGDMVSITPYGYYLKQTGETIPTARAMDSEDGQFWRCKFLAGIDTGRTRCFFKVEPGM
jgi:hypothetical protein